MAPFLPHRIMWFRRHKAIPSFSIPISLSSSSSFFLAIQTRWPGRQAITRLSRIQIDLYSGSIFNLGIVPRNCPKNNLLLSSPLLSLYLPRLSGPGGLCWYTSRRVNVWYVERIGGGGGVFSGIKGNTRVAVPTFQGDIETDRRNRIVWHPFSI